MPQRRPGGSGTNRPARPFRPTMPLLFLTTLIALGAWLVIGRLERLSPEDLPWTPLDPAQPIGLATRWKLARLADDPAACRAFLDRAGIDARPLAPPPLARSAASRSGDTRLAGGGPEPHSRPGAEAASDADPDAQPAPRCDLSTAVLLHRSSIAYRPAPVTLACPLAATLAVWERQVVEPAAEATLGARITAVDHYGTYSCRRIYGRSEGRWSEHATASAIDVAGFRTADGRTVSVLADWSGGSPQEQAFLRAVRDGSCRLFGTTLGPDYNAAHSNHFHLGIAGWRVCR